VVYLGRDLVKCRREVTSVLRYLEMNVYRNLQTTSIENTPRLLFALATLKPGLRLMLYLYGSLVTPITKLFPISGLVVATAIVCYG